MPKTGKYIYKRKDGRWEGRFIQDYRDGKARYKAVYAHSLGEVKIKLENAKAENAKRMPGSGNAGLFKIMAAMWLEEEAVHMKETTVIKYEDLLRCYILPEFGDCELSGITNEQLITFGNRLLSRGGRKNTGLSTATVSEVITIMNSVRVYALRHNRSVHFCTDCVCIRKESKDIRVFTQTEQKKLMDWLTAHMDLTSLAILLCFFTGIRLGEICALDWDNIDLEAGMIRVCKNMQRIRCRENGKTKTELKLLEPKSARSFRIIPLPSAIHELLAKYRKDEGFLLSGDDGKIVEPRTLQYRFKSILKKCGIPDANFHAIRHTFATRCVEQGFDIKCLSEILGHASVAITLNRYVHPSMELKSMNMERLSGLLGEGNGN